MWELQTPEAMKALASRLAAFVSPVDFIALYGELGAGKTTFAQGLLPALGVTEAVTSPTYGLVHGYTAAGRKINHCDFYRLGPGEEEETGFREMCAASIVIAEWPEIVEAALPASRLEVRIEGDGKTRSVSLTGFGAWQQKLARFREIDAFLVKHGWGDARCTAVRGDASARLFSRLERDGETVMLMDWPPQTRRPANPQRPPILRDCASRARGQLLHRHFRLAALKSGDQRARHSRKRSAARASILSRIWAMPFSAS